MQRAWARKARCGLRTSSRARPKATDITRDSIFAWAKEHGVTGVAMVSMDSDWSAVRLKRL